MGLVIPQFMVKFAFKFAFLGLLWAGPGFAVDGRDVEPEIANEVQSAMVTIANSERTMTCSGVLVSRRHILTAGHCVQDAGQLNFKLVTASGHEHFVKVKNISVHPLWLKNYPAYKAWFARFEALGRERKRIASRGKKLNRRFMTEKIIEVCGITKIQPLDLRDAGSISRAAERIDRYRNLIYRMNMRSSALRNERAACLTWIGDAATLLDRSTQFESESAELLAQSHFPADLAVLELRQPAPMEYRPMEFDLNKASFSAEVLLAGSGYTRLGEVGYPRVTKSMWLGEMEDTIVSGGTGTLCRGDSGGATAIVRDGRIVLIGINNAVKIDRNGEDCVAGQVVGLSTRLSDYADWIRSVIKNKDK